MKNKRGSSILSNAAKEDIVKRYTTPLSAVQKQRVNDVFVELYGYPFHDAISHGDNHHHHSKQDDVSADESIGAAVDASTDTDLTLKERVKKGINASGATPASSLQQQSSILPPPPTPPPPPKWLVQVMGNNTKHASSVWNQLSKQEQDVWYNCNNNYDVNTTTPTSAYYPKVIPYKRTSSSDNGAKYRLQQAPKSSSKGSAVTGLSNKKETTNPPSSSTIGSTQSTTTNSKSNSVTTGSDLTSLLNQLDNTKKVSTIMKTTLDWEQYKDTQLDTSTKESLQNHTTSNTAYIPQQEFHLRVDQRKYEQEKKQRLLQQQSSSSSSQRK